VRSRHAYTRAKLVAGLFMGRKVKPKRNYINSKTSGVSKSQVKGWHHSTLESELDAIGLRVNAVRAVQPRPCLCNNTLKLLKRD
jgi:hypothetical protein